MTDPFFRRVLAGLALGVGTGLFFGEAVWPLKFVSDVFIKLLQVTVLPYMIGSVIVGIGQRSTADAALLARRGGTLLLLVWGAVLLWVFVSSLAYPAIGAPGLFPGEAVAAAPIDWVELYIPANVFHALASNLLPAVVLFSILVGVAISSMPGEMKHPLLQVLEGFNEAMRRVGRAIIRLTPVGLFAMTAVAAGTLRLDDLVRLEIWIVVYVGSACVIALWLLPSLVAALTPVGHRRFVGGLRTALITAFAAGDYFVVLPMIAESCREQLEEQGVPAHDADAAVGVAVPLLFNFPHAGKVLSLAFFPFGAWYVGADLGPAHWFTIATAGVLSLFGNINAAIPFLLDLLRLPADLFNLFSVSSVLNQRFGAMVAATHTAALAMLMAASLTGRFRLRTGALLRMAITAAVVLVAFVAGTRTIFGRIIPPAPAGLAALEGFTMRHGEPAARVVPAAPASQPLPPADRLRRVLERGTLRVGFFDDGVPFTFVGPGGDLVGYDVEMAHQLAGALGVAPEFVRIDRDDLARVLDTGVCDIVMSGLVITVRTAESIDFTSPYHEELVGFLVPDHRRSEFMMVAPLQGRPLVLGAPSERLAQPMRRLLPRATVRAHPLGTVLESGELGDLDGLVLPMDQAYFVSRMQPALAAVPPLDGTVKAVVAYGVPLGAFAFRDVIDNWIDVSRAGGLFTSAYDYWVRGRAQATRAPRWSIGHDVLGLW